MALDEELARDERVIYSHSNNQHRGIYILAKNGHNRKGGADYEVAKEEKINAKDKKKVRVKKKEGWSVSFFT